MKGSRHPFLWFLLSAAMLFIADPHALMLTAAIIFVLLSWLWPWLILSVCIGVLLWGVEDAVASGVRKGMKR